MSDNLIALLRISHKHSINYLAETLKVSTGKYLSIESGKTKVTASQAIILSSLYFIEAHVFLSNEKPMININAGTSNRMIINLYTNTFNEKLGEPEDTE